MTEDDDSIDDLLRAVASAPPIAIDAAPAGPRFEGARRLGEGGFGVVWDCFDHDRGERVAVKRLREARPAARSRFKREFRLLAGASDPGLVGLHELVQEPDGALLIVMERVIGAPWDEHVAGDPARLAPALAGLARALAALHARGLVHRDLKPSNVLVEPGGRVVLLDFGLAAEQGAGSTELAGTPPYMAPEELEGAAPSPAGDAYAVGVMLFEAIAGRPPFAGSFGEVLAQKRRGPPDARALEGAPSGLAAPCLALLDPDPRARPTAAALAAALGEAAPAAQAPDEVIGRAREIAAIEAEIAAAAAGAPRVAIVRGASGVGKSALLGRVRAAVEARRPDAIVLAGRCHEHESVPYKALDAVVDALGAWLARRPEAEVAAALPRDVAALARLFPVMRRVPAVARAPEREGGAGVDARRAGAAALRELALRLGDRRPIVIVVDDLQWGDADSGALLAELVAPPDAPRIAFVGALREIADAESPFLAALGARPGLAAVPRREIALGPLSRDDARALAAAVLAGAGRPVDAADAIAEESGGSPFFVHELARAGAAAARVDDLVAARVAALAPDRRRVLEVVAIADAPVAIAVAGRAAGVADGLAAAARALAEARLARAGAAAGTLEAWHDRVRAAVVAGLAPDARRAAHAALAAALEEAGADAERVAVHLGAGGDPARAAAHAERAAARAERALAFDHAATLLRQAIALAPTDAPLGPLLRRLGDALTGAGRAAEAADAYLRAAEHFGGRDAIELRRLAGERLLGAGHVDRGKAVLASVLDRVGLALPASPARALAAFLPRRAWLAVRGTSFRERPASAIDPDELARIDVLGSASAGLAVIDPITSIALGLDGSLRALAAGEPRRVLGALCTIATEGAYLRGTAGADRTARTIDRARALAARSGHPADALLVALSEGTAAFCEGRFVAATLRLDEALRLAREHGVGSAFERPRAECLRMNVHMWRGRPGDMMRDQGELARAMADRDQLLGFTWITLYGAWTACARGDVPAAREAIERAFRPWVARGFQLQDWWRVFASVHVDVYAGRAGAAWGALSAVWPSLSRALLLEGQQHRAEARWLRARVAVALAAEDRARRDALLAEAEADLARVEAERAPWADALARLVRAGVARVRGDARAALDHLAAAEPALAAHAFDGPTACARRARGAILGGDAGRALVAEADAWLAAQGVVDPVAWCRIVAPGM